MSDNSNRSNEQNSDKPILGSLCVKGIIVLVIFSIFGVIKHPEKPIKTMFQKFSKIAVKNSGGIDDFLSIAPRGGVHVLGNHILGDHAIEGVNNSEKKTFTHPPASKSTKSDTKNGTKSTLACNIKLELLYSICGIGVEPGFFIIELMKMPEEERLSYVSSLYRNIYLKMNTNFSTNRIGEMPEEEKINKMAEEYLSEFNEMLNNKDELFYVHFNKISNQ